MNRSQRRWHQFHSEAPEDGGGAPSASGTAEVTPGTDPGSPAEADNTDTGQTPGPVPYSRFKEVNDSRRSLEEKFAPLTELEQLGYQPEDFRRLAAWEQEYASDPVGWALQNALEQEQNADVKAQIEAAIAAKDGGNADTPPAPVDAPAADTEPPEWAKPLVEKHLAAEREAELAQRAQVYDSLVDAWKQLDTTDGIRTPSEVALNTWILFASQQYSEPVDILRAARQGYLAEREEVLKEAVTPTRNGATPPSAVPAGGDGQPLVREPARPTTLDQARRAAEEADSRGTLVLDPDV
jgi:hypothetical protein